ncbi:MAG: hypothetical protein HFH49_05970 [Lachnospiraceae bacterium]|nr:hypothetical protein [Lachnospiraceae bacterium]
MDIKEVTEENVDVLSIWLDEHINNNDVWINSMLNKKTICGYSFLRESIFLGRLWCCIMFHNEEIVGVLVVALPESYRIHIKSAEVLVYYSKENYFIKEALKLLKVSWGDLIKKIKFVYLRNDKDLNMYISSEVKDIVHEISLECNENRFCIDSIFVGED